MKLRLVAIFLLFVTFTYSATVGIVVKYGNTGGIVGPLNSIGDKINGVDVCPANPTSGCDFANDPGFNDNGTTEISSDDSYNGDLIVRTNDIFEVIAAVRWNGNSAEDTGRLTGTLPTKNGKQYFEFADLPGICDSSSSSISEDKQTIVCNVIGFDRNKVGTIAMDIPINVRVRGFTPDGTEPGDITFKVEAVNAVEQIDTTDGYSLTVTAAPRWNIQKGHYTYYTGESDPNDPNVKGWIIDYTFNIEADEVNGETDSANPVLGNESLGTSTALEFIDDISLVAPNAKLHSCSMNGRYKTEDGYNGSSQPVSFSGPGSIKQTTSDIHIPQLKDEKAINCIQNGSSIEVKLTNIDASLNSYPTKSYNGANLPVNRAIAAIGNIRVFVPLSDVQKGADGQLNTADDGTLVTHNHITGFDPVAPSSGNSNFAGAVESDKDNHDYLTLYYSAGGWDKYYRGTREGENGDKGIWAYIGSGYRSGNGTAGKGSEFSSALHTSNYGGTSFTEDTICDVFDAYRMELRPTGENSIYKSIQTRYAGDPSLPYRFLIEKDSGNYTDANGVAGNPYIVEYASTYVDDNFLPSKGGDTHADVSQKIKTECADPNIQWTTDFAAARAVSPIGVTKVRMRLKPGYEHPPAAYLYTWLNYVVRSKDLATNAPFNNGDLFVNYAAHKFNGQNWNLPSYKPKIYTEAHGGSAGDRLIYTGAKVRIVKEEDKTAAGPGIDVKYTLKSTFTNDTGTQDHGNVKITDVLPKDFSYITGSSVPYGDPVIGDCSMVADMGETCVDGQNQVLVWDLGDREVNGAIEDISYSVIIGATANIGPNINHVKIESLLDSSLISQRKANIGLNIIIPSTINIVKNTIENPAYPSKRERTTDAKDIKYVMNLRNGSAYAISDLDIIDLLPFVGDGDPDAISFIDIKVKRNQSTHFHGTQVFHKITIAQHPLSGSTCGLQDPKYYYTNIDPKAVNMAPSVSDANKLDNAASIWCEGNVDGPNGCTIASSGFTFTDNSQVTAVRVKDKNIAFDSQAVCAVVVDVAVKDNLVGDLYVNSAGASAQGVTLPVLSNSVAVPIVGSSLGDRVWYDKNQDGVQDAGENGISGVRVHLLDSAGNPVKNPADPLNDYVVATDANGNYKFEKLNHGDYIVRFEPVAGYLLSPKGTASNETNSDVNSNYRTDIRTLGVDVDDPTVDMGVYTPVISGNIFHDTDGPSSINGSSVSVIDGSTLYVTLLDANGNLLSSKAVENDGTYAFDAADGVKINSNYTVVLTPVVNSITPSLTLNWVTVGENINSAGSTNDGSANGQIAVAVTTANVPLIDFGIKNVPVVPTIDIELAVNGDDADREIDAVLLARGDDVTWSYVVTNRGNESLENIVVTDENGNVTCPKTVLAEGESMTCTVTGEKALLGDNSKTATVNGKGAQSGDSVNDSDPAHYKVPIEPAIDIEKYINTKDADTTAIALIVEDDIVWEFVVRNVGNEDLENIVVTDADFGNIVCPKSSLVQGESMRCTAVTGKAEAGKHGAEATVNGVGITSGTSVSDADPAYYFAASTAHIGDYFWIDADMDGSQDANETVVVGATVELFDAAGNPATDINGNHSVVTDANGKYGFDVSPGTYQVKFSIPQTYIDQGYVFTDTNSGDDASDSDTAANGFTQTITVGAGDNIMTLDAGLSQCDCANVSSDSSDTFTLFGMIAMMLFTLFTALFFVRKEEELRA